MDSSTNISTARTNLHSTLQTHDATQQVSWEMLFQICNMKFDNMVTNCLHLSYIMTG